MKLYRGIKTSQFRFIDRDLERRADEAWMRILRRRAAGRMNFPRDLASEIADLAQWSRWRRQHFTDDRKIATEYAKKQGGVVLEVNVPVDDIVRYFEIEFQNFGKRHSNFELVYAIDSRMLDRMKKRWKLKFEVM